MNSLGSDCNELKKQYDACFNAWFSGRFLHGDTDDSVCSQMFKVYQECVKLQKAMQEHKIELRDIEHDYSTGDFKSSDKTTS